MGRICVSMLILKAIWWEPVITFKPLPVTDLPPVRTRPPIVAFDHPSLRQQPTPRLASANVTMVRAMPRSASSHQTVSPGTL